MWFDLFKDLWLERRRPIFFWCAAGLGWNIFAALAYPAVQGEEWLDRLLTWFALQSGTQKGYWLLVLMVLGSPIIGGGYAFLEGNHLFKGRGVRQMLAFLLAYPLPRWEVYLSRVVYLFSASFLLVLCIFTSGTALTYFSANPMPGGMWRMWTASILLVFLLGLAGVLVGNLGASRWMDRLAGLLVLGWLYLPYVQNSTAGLVRLSPLFYVLGETPTNQTFVMENGLILFLLCAIVGVLGGFAFERLELN